MQTPITQLSGIRPRESRIAQAATGDITEMTSRPGRGRGDGRPAVVGPLPLEAGRLVLLAEHGQADRHASPPAANRPSAAGRSRVASHTPTATSPAATTRARAGRRRSAARTSW